MNQRLCIGIQKLDPSWEAILNDLGLWFEEIEYSTKLLTQYSLLILNEVPQSAEISLLNDYLREGGALLELKAVHAFTDKKESKITFLKTVIDRSQFKPFNHIPFLDLYDCVELHNNSEIFSGLVYFEKHKHGILGFLGADIPKLLRSAKYRRKRFYAGDQGSPDEIVSTVSKHELIEVLRATIAHLHYERDLPFILKWSSPSKNPVFCFRVDSDFGDKPSIRNLYDLCSRQCIKATWFLHVQAHENWLDLFRTFKNQEIALHGYKHGTSKSTDKKIRNIKKGKHLLESSEINIDGYCAPYGIWNTALEKALADFDFKYTSEFTFKYDGFPITSSTNENRLQIPIHPICTGSLNRRHYDQEQMNRYFDRVIENKSSRFEPILLYHHPMQPGIEVIEHLFKEINKQEFQPLTFSEYADFWVRRKRNNFEAYYDGIELKIDSTENQFFQSSADHNGFHLIQAETDQLKLTKTPKYEYRSRDLPSTEKIEEMHRTDLRLLKTSLWDWKNRIRL